MKEQVIIQLSPQGNINFIGPDEEKPNCESWYIDGVEYTIAYDKPVVVPLELAKAMKNAGRIKNYTPVPKA